MTLILRRCDLDGLVTLAECADAVEDAFRRHSASRLADPLRTTLISGPGSFHVTLGALPPPGSLATKVNGWFPTGEAGPARPNGAILLADAATGDVQSLMDSQRPTQLRTAALTVVAVRRFSSPGAHRVAVLGAGAQCRLQLEAIRLALPEPDVLLWSRTFDRAAQAAEHAGPGVRAVEDIAEATADADVIVTLTPSAEPILDASHVRPGTLVVALGADAPNKNELSAELSSQARFITDITSQCVTSGELRTAVAAGVMRVDDVHAQLGEILAGSEPSPRQTPSDIVIVDSTGTAIQDVAAARLFFDAAMQAGRGVEIELRG